MSSARIIRVADQLLHLCRLIPMMICRMAISLKKAASTEQYLGDTEVPSVLPVNLQDAHSPRAMENIQLSVFKR